MSKIYLFDTCIWRDFYEKRISKNGKPLGEYANKLFRKILKSKHRILFSDALIWELEKDYNEKEIYNMLNLLIICKLLNKLEITKEEHLEAKKLARERNIPYVDCLNAIQARNNGAVLVTQDAHFFRYLTDIVKSVRPQDII